MPARMARSPGSIYISHHDHLPNEVRIPNIRRKTFEGFYFFRLRQIVCAGKRLWLTVERITTVDLPPKTLTIRVFGLSLFLFLFSLCSTLFWLACDHGQSFLWLLRGRKRRCWIERGQNVFLMWRHQRQVFFAVRWKKQPLHSFSMSVSVPRYCAVQPITFNMPTSYQSWV